jgi:heptaprenyl diphosphate synthase
MVTKQLFTEGELLKDLKAVEQHLLDRVESRSELITVAGRHIISAGGKRLRASLVLLAAQLGRYELDAVLHAATAVELIHSASLVHDDLIDETALRRGRPTVHRKWNHNVAIMAGDYLFALAAGEMALAPDPRVIQIFARGVMAICEAELHYVEAPRPLDRAITQYYTKIGGKTAALFEAATSAGMICGRGNQREIEALARYGYDVGLAFQIVDDVLDYVSDETTLGKPAGNDLREGTITLPLIYAVDGGASELLELCNGHQPSPEDIKRAVVLVDRAGGTERAMDEARRVAERAVAALEIFPDSPPRQALADIAEFVVERRT